MQDIMIHSYHNYVESMAITELKMLPLRMLITSPIMVLCLLHHFQMDNMIIFEEELSNRENF